MGEILWEQCFGGNLYDGFHDMIEVSNGHITLLGYVGTSNHSGNVQCDNHGPGRTDVWLVSATDTTVMGIGKSLIDDQTLQLFPNPASDEISFVLPGWFDSRGSIIRIYNTLGQIQAKINLNPGQKKATWKFTGQKPGCYFYFIKGNYFQFKGKFFIRP